MEYKQDILEQENELRDDPLFDLLRDNRRRGLWFAAGFAALSVLLFALFYPVLSGEPYDPDATALGSALRQWLPTWPI